MQKTARNNSHKETIEETCLLIDNKAREALKNLDGWQLTDDHKMIYREFILHDFMAAVDMIDRIALIAENEKHHPDIHLTQYRNLRIALTSHDVGGLSQKDFIVAVKINDLPKLINKPQSAVPLNQQLMNKAQKTVQSKLRQGIRVALKKNRIAKPIKNA